MLPRLTQREYDVLVLMQTWLTYAEIGIKLSISINTVKSHAKTIFAKLGVCTRREAVACARENGLISPIHSL